MMRQPQGGTLIFSCICRLGSFLFCFFVFFLFFFFGGGGGPNFEFQYFWGVSEK